MQSLKFYSPSNGKDQDAFIEHTWNQGAMPYLIFVRRMSLRGNPYIKGAFLLNEDTTAPSEFECTQLSEEAFSCLVSELQEELSIKNNGVELGR